MTDDPHEPAPTEIDLATLAAMVGAGWRRIVGGLLLGLAGAGAVLFFVPPRFEGETALLVRTSQDPTSLLKQKLGPLAELAPAALGGGSQAQIETELALLQSRNILGRAVDSLRLQVRPRSPGRVPPALLVDSVRTTGRFAPEKLTLAAGLQPVPGGQLAAAKGGAGAAIRLVDREDAIDRLGEDLDVRIIGGEVVRIRYRGYDSVTAASVPNLIVAAYLERRRTVDRGVNQRRFEFLSAKADSVAADWRRQAADLRRAQDSSGIFAAEPAARALIERVGAVEVQLGELRAEQVALDSVLGRSRSPAFDPRMVATVPSLLKSPAVNEIVAQLERVESQRGLLAAQLTDEAPSMVAARHVADSLRNRLIPLARSHAEALRQQRQSLERDLDRARASLAALPRQSEIVTSHAQLLAASSALNAGMAAQVLEARLAALTEGGDVRVVDPAVTPRRVAFPKPLITLLIGAAIGLALGLSFAVVLPTRGR